jgi:hypothetical protein
MNKIKETFWSRNFGLQEQFADKDGLYNGCLNSPEQARILMYMSFWGFITGLTGIYYNYKWLGLSCAIGSIFAMIYWYRPCYSWRRTLDITWVQFLIWSHLWVAIGTSQMIPYIIIQIFGAICYVISWIFMKYGDSWGSLFSHAMVHVCANTSLLLLYTS